LPPTTCSACFDVIVIERHDNYSKQQQQQQAESNWNEVKQQHDVPHVCRNNKTATNEDLEFLFPHKTFLSQQQIGSCSSSTTKQQQK